MKKSWFKALAPICSAVLIAVLLTILVPAEILITGKEAPASKLDPIVQTQPQLGEITAKRDATSKTYYLGNGKYSLDASIGAVHYKDTSNTWQNIDNEFVPAQAPWNWQMLGDDYHIKVKNDFTAGQIIEFEKEGETLYFQPMALEWTNDFDQIQPVSMPQGVAPNVSNPPAELLPNVPNQLGTIKWANGYGQGIDFQWQCTPSRLIKILAVSSLNNLPVPESYIISGGNPVLRLNLIFSPSANINIYVNGNLWDKKTKVQTFNIIRFDKATGGNLWNFMPLLYWDNSDNNTRQSVSTLEKRGNNLYVSIRVPYSWLQSAVYPVSIDQTVEVFPTYYRYFHAESTWLSDMPDGITPAIDTASLNNVADVLIKGFTSEALNYSSLSAGAWAFHLWGKHDGTTCVVSLFVQVRKNTSSGTLLATSSYTNLLTTTEAEQICGLSFPQTAWTSGDKLWVGVYAHVTTKQNGKKAYFYYDHSSRLSMTADPTIDPDPIIGASADDMHERQATGVVTDSATGVTCSSSSTNPYWAGFRFVSAQFPVGGSTITACYFSVNATSATVDDANFLIHLEELAAPAQFVAGTNYNITLRDKTEASVSWIANSLGTSRVNSPDLSGADSPSDEIWAADHDNLSPTAVVIILEANTDVSKNLAVTPYNASTTWCASFHIEWEEGAGVSAPTVTTQAATSITSNFAIANGNITVSSENCTSRFIQYGLEPGTYTANVTETGSFGTGAFTENLTGLLSYTTYFYRAGAANSGGTGYGAEVSFTTAFVPQVTIW